MPTDADINAQRRLLESHRRNLQLYLEQRASLGATQITPAVDRGIDEVRGNIRQVKATLSAWGVAVESLPIDEVISAARMATPPQASTPPRRQRRACTGRLMELAGLIVALVGCLAAVVVVPEVREWLRLDRPASEAPAASGSAPVVADSGAMATTASAQSGAESASPVSVGGSWKGTLVYILGEQVANYRYRLDLTQDGDLILGTSRIERIENPEDFAEYSIGAQFVQIDGALYLSVSESDLLRYHNYVQFDDSAVRHKVMLLQPIEQQGERMLAGEWRAYTSNIRSEGKIRLTLSP